MNKGSSWESIRRFTKRSRI